MVVETFSEYSAPIAEGRLTTIEEPRHRGFNPKGTAARTARLSLRQLGAAQLLAHEPLFCVVHAMISFRRVVFGGFLNEIENFVTEPAVKAQSIHIPGFDSQFGKIKTLLTQDRLRRKDKAPANSVTPQARQKSQGPEVTSALFSSFYEVNPDLPDRVMSSIGHQHEILARQLLLECLVEDCPMLTEQAFPLEQLQITLFTFSNVNLERDPKPSERDMTN